MAAVLDQAPIVIAAIEVHRNELQSTEIGAAVEAGQLESTQLDYVRVLRVDTVAEPRVRNPNMNQFFGQDPSQYEPGSIEYQKAVRAGEVLEEIKDAQFVVDFHGTTADDETNEKEGYACVNLETIDKTKLKTFLGFLALLGITKIVDTSPYNNMYAHADNVIGIEIPQKGPLREDHTIILNALAKLAAGDLPDPDLNAFKWYRYITPEATVEEYQRHGHDALRDSTPDRLIDYLSAAAVQALAEVSKRGLTSESKVISLCWLPNKRTDPKHPIGELAVEIEPPDFIKSLIGKVSPAAS